MQPQILHLTNGHSTFDDRIYYKELKSLTNKFECFELVASIDEKSIFTMGNKKLPIGVYDNIHCLAYKKIKHNFFWKCMNKALPIIKSYLEYTKINNILVKNGIKPVIIHYHEIELTDVVIKLKKIFKCKTIFDCHEFYFSYPFNSGLTRKTLRHSSKMLLKMKKTFLSVDYVISVTKTLDNIISIIRKDNNHSVIYNSSIFPMNSEKRELISDKKIVLLHEGSMPFTRGLKLMLEIFKNEYIKENFQLRIVGTLSGKEKEYYEKKIKEYNLTEDNIYYTGWVDYLSLPDQLKGDIGILFFEKSFNTFYSMPNKLFNYSVTGIPLLATHCADLTETIDNLKCGITVERNVNSVVNGLKELVNNYSFYQTNVLKIQEQFHWTTEESKLISLYEKVLIFE